MKRKVNYSLPNDFLYGIPVYLGKRTVEDIDLGTNFMESKPTIEHNATVRQTAKEFGISKSTVHVVVTKWNGNGKSYYWNEYRLEGRYRRNGDNFLILCIDCKNNLCRGF